VNAPSSRNEEIHPLADFKAHAIPLSGAPAANGAPAGSKCANQVIHPFADFHDFAITLDGKKSAADEPGKNAKLADETRSAIVLEPDVAAAFPDSASVNEALRALVNIARRNGNSHPAN
jgi:hypothetical protein